MGTEYAAIMFADVSGSSSLFKRIGDVEARAVISRVVDMMMEKTCGHHGTVIKTIGDECMSSFPEPEYAVEAALSIQKNISTHDYGAPLTIRIGLHYGPIINEGDDVFGEAVNDAAALVKVAKGRQIITSESTRKVLPPVQRQDCRLFDEIRIKGGDTQESIYIIDWEDEGQESNATQFMTAINPALMQEAAAPKVIELTYLGETIRISEKQVPFTIGREKYNDLPVLFRMASREHCKIDYSRGKFVLIDNSTNGTHLIPEGRDDIYLRREEVPLTGSGVISFSPDYEVEGPHRLEYSC